MASSGLGSDVDIGGNTPAAVVGLHAVESPVCAAKEGTDGSSGDLGGSREEAAALSMTPEDPAELEARQLAEDVVLLRASQIRSRRALKVRPFRQCNQR